MFVFGENAIIVYFIVHWRQPIVLVPVHYLGGQISFNSDISGVCLTELTAQVPEYIPSTKALYLFLNKLQYFLSFSQPDGTELFHFVDGYPSWDAYLTSMMVDGTWGDHVILHGAANFFQTCIHVISSLPHRHDVMICPEFDVSGSNRLVLGHVHELHYVSLIPHNESKGV